MHRNLSGACVVSFLTVFVFAYDAASAHAQSTPYESVSVPAAPQASPSGETNSSGARAGFVTFQTLHGLTLGFELCALADCDDSRALIGSGMLGAGAGFVASYFGTSRGITPGFSASLNSGVLWGAWLGFVLPHAVDESVDGQTTLGTMIGGQLLGMGAGYLAYALWEPSSGQVAVANSAGIWLSALTMASMFTISDRAEPEGVMASLAISGVGGILLGGVLASHVPMSNGRVLLIDAAGLLGGLAGVGIPFLIAGDNLEPRFATGFGAAGALGGLILGYVLTRTWDLPDVPDTQLSFAPVDGGAIVTARVRL